MISPKSTAEKESGRQSKKDPPAVPVQAVVKYFLVFLLFAALLFGASLAFPSVHSFMFSSSRKCQTLVGANGATFKSPSAGAGVSQHITVTGLVSCPYINDGNDVLEVVVSYGTTPTWYPEAAIPSSRISDIGQWTTPDQIKVGNPQDHGLTYGLAIFFVSASQANLISQETKSRQAQGEWGNQGIPYDDLGEELASETVQRS